MPVNPLLLLLIGVLVVVGMILVLRLNAFIALITAALLMSLLSPGEASEKVSRVAEAFGGVVGGIGIVIALAAVIGKCLMDSGAADRIVRSFLGVLGEKRAASALMLCAGHARRLKSASMEYNDTYFKLKSRASPNGGEG